MTGKTHAICGLVTASAVVAYTLCCSTNLGIDTLLPPLSLATVSLGSYMPDIDLHTSKLGSKHPWIAKHLKHRGITHTLFFPFILLLVQLYFLLFNPIPIVFWLITGFNIGWVAHILADMCNKTGVPIFWPFIKSKLHVASVLTGSYGERTFLGLWIILNLIILCIFIFPW